MGIFSHDDAKERADQIIKKEVEEFKLKAENELKDQVKSTIDNLLHFGQERIQVCRRVLKEYGYSDLDPAKKKQIDMILNSRLKITAEEINKILKEEIIPSSNFPTGLNINNVAVGTYDK